MPFGVKLSTERYMPDGTYRLCRGVMLGTSSP
jgi:hypothetical protein